MAEGKALDSRVEDALAMRTDTAGMAHAMDLLANVLHLDELDMTMDTQRNGELALAACAASGLDLRGGSSGKAALRRTVGPKLKQQSLGVAMRFLEECAPLERSVRAIDAAAIRVVQGCGEVQMELSRVQEEATAYLELEEHLQHEINSLGAKRTSVEEFVNAVSLTDQQRLSLTRPLDGAALATAASLPPPQDSISSASAATPASSTLPVVEAAEAFLESLNTVNCMRKRCQAGQEAGLITAATQQDSSLAQLQTTAAMTAFNAVKDAAPGMSRDFSVGSRAGRALRGLVAALALSPDLLQACVEVVTGCRKRALTRLLVRSLARGEQRLRTGSNDGYRSSSSGSAEGAGVGDLALAGMLGDGSRVMVTSSASEDSTRASGDLPDVLIVDIEMGSAAVSALLAWCHQGLAAERETMLALFGGVVSSDDDATESGVIAGKQISSFDELKIVSTVANGLCSPVRVRLEQIVERLPTSEPREAFAVADVMAFFASVVSRLTGSLTGLPETLLAVAALADSRFVESVKTWATRGASGIPRLPASLSAPDAVTTTAAGLAGLCRLPGSSMAGDNTRSDTAAGVGGDGDEPQAGVSRHATSADTIASAGTDPIVKAVSACSEGMGVAEHAIWMANTLDVLIAALKGIEGVASKVADLVAQRSYHTDTIVQTTINSTLSTCGVLALLRAAESHDPAAESAAGEVPAAQLSSQAAFSDIEAVRAAASAFVSHCTALPAGPAAHLDNPRLRTEVRAAVTAVLVTAYETLFDAIADPRNGFGEGAVASLLPHSASDFRTMVE